MSEDETPLIPADLSIVKIYGGITIFGGSHGFLGIGLISRTTGESPAAMAAAAAASATSITPGPADGASSGIEYHPHIRKAMFCWPCTDAITEDTPGASTAPTDNPTASPTSSPHLPQAHNFITALAVAKNATVFAAADTNGVISLWHLPKSKYLHTLNHLTVLSNRSMHTVIKRLRPKLIAAVNVHNLSHEQGQVFDKPSSRPQDTTLEKIIKMQFVVNDNYFLISTQKRLLLLTLKTQEVETASRGMSISEMRGVSFAEGGLAPDGAGSMPFMQNKVVYSTKIHGFNSWVELDRALPGFNATFDVYVDESTSAMRVKPDNAVLSSLRNSITFGMSPMVPGMDFPTKPAIPHAGMSFVEWRIVENDDPSPITTGVSFFGSKIEASAAKKCTVSRVVWTEVMITAAIERAKPCI